MPSGRLRTTGSAVALLGIATLALCAAGACTSSTGPVGGIPSSASTAVAGTPALGGSGGGVLPVASSTPGVNGSTSATGESGKGNAPALPDPEMTTIGASSSCTNHTHLGDRAPVRPEQLFARGGESGFEADRVVPGPGGGAGGAGGAAGTGSCAAVLPAAPDSVLDFGASPGQLSSTYEWYAAAVARCGVGAPGSIGGVSGLVGSGHRPTLLSTIPGRFLVTEDGSRLVVLVFEGGAWSDTSRASAARRVLPLLRAT